MFSTPIDICNRALQHCGVEMLDPTLGFSEISDRANQVAFAYDKVRRFELRRNTWQFSIKRTVIRPLIIPGAVNASGIQLNPSLQITPQLWNASATYFVGSVVEDSTGAFWVSLIPDNLNNAPGLTGAWDPYYGPSVATAYDTTGQTAYFAGDVIYISSGGGQLSAYMSRMNSNSAVPTAIDTWLATTVYMKDSIVTDGIGNNYQSLIDVNVNQQPTLVGSPPLWNSSTVYAATNKVVGSDGLIYQSINNGNVNNNPVTDFTHTFWTATGTLAAWTVTLTRPLSADEWLVLGAQLTSVPSLISPLGMAMNVNGPQRSVYPLPANFLRICPQDPKQGSVSYLGAPSGNQYLDWILDGPYLVTRTNTPIVLRFVADVMNVREMDDMFCEGLAARIAYEIAPKLTQSVSKRNDIAKAYQTFMMEARIVNGIEEGATEPPEDDYITSRL